MTASAPDPTSVNSALRRLHRSTIASLALCATGIGIASWARGGPPHEDAGDPYSWIALALAGIAILTRRSDVRAGRSLRSHVYGSLVSLTAAAGLGILGMVVELCEGRATAGLLYTLAGALLALRPPAPLPDPAGTGA